VNNAIFVTDSDITEGTGGGMVGKHIVNSLSDSHENVRIIDRKINIPSLYNQPLSPFLTDYFSAHLAYSSLTKYNTIVFYGAPFMLTLRTLKRFSSTAKVVSDVAPHSIEESAREHVKWGLPYNYPHLISPKLWKMYTDHIKYSDIIVVHSKVGAQYLSEKIGVNKERFKVIPHGCNIPKEIKDYPKDFIVGYLGVNGVDKGVVYLMESLKLLPTGCKILFGGRGTEKIGGLGFVNDSSKIYNGISVYVQPSVTEGFGIEVVEAMSFKRPVITTYGTGAADLIVEGWNGFIVPIRNPTAIAEKLTYFKDNPSEIKRMGENAFETAKKTTWNIVEKEYIKIWK
jgi:glycosyltransferase involved in cell wall biosynthesis